MTTYTQIATNKRVATTRREAVKTYQYLSEQQEHSLPASDTENH